MKTIIFLLAILVGTKDVSAQTNQSEAVLFAFTSPWIKQNGYVAYMYPSFLQLQNTTPTIDLTGYEIKSSDMLSGKISLGECSVSQKEALTAALMLIGGNYETVKYGISKDYPNLIPYRNGVIIYGYWKEKERWEIFNVNAPSLTEHLPYRRFDVVKK